MAAKPSTPKLIGVALLVLFTLFITWKAKSLEKRLNEGSDASAQVGKIAADFSLTSLDGKTISLSDYHGKKKVVVSYWASWCGPCRMELPLLAEFYKKYHKDASNFEILAISIDDDRSAAERFANDAKLPFPILLDLDSKVAETYSVDAIPSVFVVDVDGKIVYGITGTEQGLELQLSQHLGIKWSPTIPGSNDNDSSR